MKNFEYIKALTDIDENYIEEAAEASYTAKFSHNRKIVMLVAAVMLVLLATGAAWVVSSLSVDVEELGTTDEGYELNIPKADIPEDLRRDLEELELLTAEEMTELEREYASYMYGFTRLEHIAENYGHAYKGRILYEYFDEIGDNDAYYFEAGAFYDENGDVFVFCHTNDPDFENHTLLCLLYSDPETKEEKYEYVIFDKVGAYTAVISDDEGWTLEGAFMMFMYNEEPIGGHSGLVPGGNLTEKDYTQFVSRFHTATADFVDYVLFGEEFIPR
ncbi:MAG: hypothetical protein IJ424_04450 [Oscillospiraceae bacterium]|nr:hypothetical protein [Oscillospiraceae bacterium]